MIVKRVAMGVLILALHVRVSAQDAPQAEELRKLKDLRADGNATWSDGGLKFQLSVTGSKAIADNTNAVIALLPIESKFTPPMLPPQLAAQMRDQVERQAKATNDMFVQQLQDVFRDKFLKLGYQVVEREEIEKIVKEQNLSSSNLVSREKKIEMGKLLSAKFLYLQQVQSVTFADFQTGTSKSEYTYSGRFIDAETGMVRATVAYYIAQ